MRRLTEPDCPACGAPTYTPSGPQTSDAEPKAREAASPLVGLLVALLGGGALLGALSMPWYTIELPTGLRGLLEGFARQSGAASRFDHELQANAWEAFEIADVALAAAAGVTFALVAAAVMARASARTVARALQLAGGFVIGLTLFRMVDQPEPAQFLALQSGPWVALIAGAGIVLGSGLIADQAR